MTRRNAIVKAGAQGNPYEQIKKIEAEEARIEAEEARKKKIEMAELLPKERKILGPKGDVIKDYLDTGIYPPIIMAIGPLADKVWVTKEERRSFSERTGFSEKLFRRFSLDYDGRDAGAFCREHGFRDMRSYGRFMSLGHDRELPAKEGLNLQRIFFGALAEPLLKELKGFGDNERDKKLHNFELIMKQFPIDFRTGLFLRLSNHPKALNTLIGINAFDQRELQNFFVRFINNEACFDGIVRE